LAGKRQPGAICFRRGKGKENRTGVHEKKDPVLRGSRKAVRCSREKRKKKREGVKISIKKEKKRGRKGVLEDGGDERGKFFYFQSSVGTTSRPPHEKKKSSCVNTATER